MQAPTAEHKASTQAVCSQRGQFLDLMSLLYRHWKSRPDFIRDIMLAPTYSCLGNTGADLDRVGCLAPDGVQRSSVYIQTFLTKVIAFDS